MAQVLADRDLAAAAAVTPVMGHEAKGVIVELLNQCSARCSSPTTAHRTPTFFPLSSANWASATSLVETGFKPGVRLAGNNWKVIKYQLGQPAFKITEFALGSGENIGPGGTDKLIGLQSIGNRFKYIDTDHEFTASTPLGAWISWATRITLSWRDIFTIWEISQLHYFGELFIAVIAGQLYSVAHGATSTAIDGSRSPAQPLGT